MKNLYIISVGQINKKIPGTRKGIQITSLYINKHINHDNCHVDPNQIILFYQEKI